MKTQRLQYLFLRCPKSCKI